MVAGGLERGCDQYGVVACNVSVCIVDSGWLDRNVYLEYRVAYIAGKGSCNCGAGGIWSVGKTTLQCTKVDG